MMDGGVPLTGSGCDIGRQGLHATGVEGFRPISRQQITFLSSSGAADGCAHVRNIS